MDVFFSFCTADDGTRSQELTEELRETELDDIFHYMFLIVHAQEE